MKHIFMVLALLSALAPVTAAAVSSTEEQSAWLAASASDSKDAYSDFIAKFPDGAFAPLARIRLEEGGDSTPVVAGPIADLAPLESRYSQKRTIEPRAKGNCLEAPDASCLLFEVTRLIDKQTDASHRVNYLSTLAQEVARAGDVAGSVKLLRQATSVARGLPSVADKAGNLASVASAAALAGNVQLAGELLNEALTVARSVNSGKTENQLIVDRGRALIDVASRMALLGKVDTARPIFAEAQSLTAQLSAVYKATLIQGIMEKQADGGLLKDALLTLADYLNLTNDMPQYSTLGVVEILGRYSNMADAAEFLVAIGQDRAAVTLARSIGPLTIRVETLLRVRDKLSEKGARDLSELDNEIRDLARDAAKVKDAWIYAGQLGCAVARFGSAAEGVSLARNLFAKSIGNPPYFNQKMFVECLARNVGPEEASDYLMAIPETDRSSTADYVLYYFEEVPRNRIKALAIARRFKEAIAEAMKLENSRDNELSAIVTWAVNGHDLNSAVEAAKLISNESSKLGAYTAIIEIL